MEAISRSPPYWPERLGGEGQGSADLLSPRAGCLGASDHLLGPGESSLLCVCFQPGLVQPSRICRCLFSKALHSPRLLRPRTEAVLG